MDTKTYYLAAEKLAEAYCVLRSLSDIDFDCLENDEDKILLNEAYEEFIGVKSHGTSEISQ